MLQWLESFFGAYGYVVVGLVVALESMGLPLPGETVLLAAAAYAGAGGRLNVAGVIGCASAGAILGDTVSYWLGRLGGLPLFERYGRHIWVEPPKARSCPSLLRAAWRQDRLLRPVRRLPTDVRGGSSRRRQDAVWALPYLQRVRRRVLGSGHGRPGVTPSAGTCHFSSARCGGSDWEGRAS